jgi:hypothetical protein
MFDHGALILFASAGENFPGGARGKFISGWLNNQISTAGA